MSLDDLDWPRMYQVSASVARRIPWHHTIEVGYVGTFGRHLAAQHQINSVPVGHLLQRARRQRGPLHPGPPGGPRPTNVVNARRPFPTLQNVNIFEPIGESNYHGLQMTLSRQTGRFTYLAAYTLLEVQGHDRQRLRADRPARSRRAPTATLARRPHAQPGLLLDGAPGRPGPEQRASARRFLNGWNLSGISTYVSGQPIRLGFAGDLGTRPGRAGLVRHAGLPRLQP